MMTLLESCVIKPAQETSSGLMSLSEFDQVAPITYSPVLYFYQGPIEFDNAVVNIKDSLSKILVPFYPLAGRLRDIGEGRFEVDCKPLGAKFYVVKSKATIKDFGDFQPTTHLQALVPQVDSSNPKLLQQNPLLLVQVTNLDCGGICLGIAVSHIMADGSSMAHFTSEWARLARGGDHEKSISNLPFLDRTVLQADNKPMLISSLFDHPGYSPPPLLAGRSDMTEERMKESRIVTLKLSKQEVEKIKNNANINHNSNKLSRCYSRFEAVAGHIWRCGCKARRHVDTQLTRLYFPMDVRNRVDPPLPKYYFGNAMCRAAATSTSGELISRPLSYASSKIREAIERATDEYVRSTMHLLKNLKDLSEYRNSHYPGCAKGVYHGNPNMATNTWTSMRMYDADFGWGKPIYNGLTSIGLEGKSYIMETSQQDGSFLVLLRLQVAHLEDFKKFFYADIESNY